MTSLKMMFAKLNLTDDGGLLTELQVRPTLNDEIQSKQSADESLATQLRQVEEGKATDFSINAPGILCFHGRHCVFDDRELKQSILRKVKVEHQFPLGLSQPIQIPKWKWEHVTMDFLSGLPLTPTKKDSVWVIVDPLTKSAHFLPVRTDYSLHKLVGLDIEFSVGDQVILKISPWKNVLRFGRKGKLSLRFLGPYEVLKRIRPVAYQLELPSKLDCIHDVLHVSMLRRYHFDPSHVILIDEINVRLYLTYDKVLVQILDHEVEKLRKKQIPLVKVLWQNHGDSEATWEPKETMYRQYPHSFGLGKF
ncbi:hypothetical protein EPI10_016227 [Gossypium australe]|uniref:DNA/RNA polymerases superfamily protein n=1 Tax=Gossypium australe TaxID=47621 RepID=A0A5B6VN09_9ROSI|nr:hypothetical protein EPI10_016227 [Gossypium australe]